MLRALIHALTVAVVGIFISAQVMVFAHAHMPTSDYVIADTWGEPDASTDDSDHRKEHGGQPCSHGGCAACCGGCAWIGACVLGRSIPTFGDATPSRVLNPRPLLLVDLQLKRLPYRPPCVDA